MKSLAHPSFFRLFDLLLGAANPGMKLSSWMHDGVTWQRERHSFTGSRYGLSIEIFMLTETGKRGWNLLIVKEHWWVGKDSKPAKAARWAKLIDGKRSDAMTWFRAQESSLGQR